MLSIYNYLINNDDIIYINNLKIISRYNNETRNISNSKILNKIFENNNFMNNFGYFSEDNINKIDDTKNNIDDKKDLIIPKCSICMEYNSKIIFTPCNHICSCINCSKKLNECPICRKYISRKSEIFYS